MEVTILTGKRQSAGFAYMALLVVIAASLIVLSSAIPDIYQTAKREREAQLFFVGEQYRSAIKRYYQNPKVSSRAYPDNLKQLVSDDRTAKPSHYLRRLYRDPMTRDGKWGLILNENNKIIGVYSRSQQKLLKQNFDHNIVTVMDQTGSRQLTYSDLKFMFSPK